jgi:heme-degrading monooxygenase HmoA
MPAITLVNCFEVPAGREDEFFAMWKQVNTYMRQKPGYLEHKLHRSLAPDAPFRFINIARWASQEDFDAAHDEGFRGSRDSARLGRVPFPPGSLRGCPRSSS